MFVAKFRFGCKPNLPGLGSETVIFSKIDTYGERSVHPIGINLGVFRSSL